MICSRFMCVNEATDFCNGRCARCYAELRLHGTPVVETVAKTVWDGANGMFDDGPITETFKNDRNRPINWDNVNEITILVWLIVLAATR